MTDSHPEDEAISQVLVDDSTSAGDVQPDVDVPLDDGPVSGHAAGWKWLIAGVIAAIFLPVVLSFVTTSFQAEEVEAVFARSDSGEISAEDEAIAEAAELKARLTNEQRLVMASGGVIAIVFGLFAGIASGRPVMGLLGLIGGFVVIAAVAFGGSGLILDLERAALDKMRDGDIQAMGVHAAQWLMISVAALVAVGVGTGSVKSGVKAFAALALAGLFGAVIYVMGGAILAPTSNTSLATPIAGSPLYLWASLPPLLASVFMARASVSRAPVVRSRQPGDR